MIRNEDLHEDLLRPDQSDRATAMEELRRRAALAVRQPEGPAPTGHCLNCDARLAPRQRWCDAHCRDDWEKEQRRIAA
jgi:hypothetical protein